MTNTTPTLSQFDKVSALVDVESAGVYTGPISAAIRAGVAEGYLQTWASFVLVEDGTPLRLTTAGRERLAGFRALLAPLD